MAVLQFEISAGEGGRKTVGNQDIKRRRGSHDVSSVKEFSEPRRNAFLMMGSSVRGGMLVQRWGVDLCGIRSLPPLTLDPQASFLMSVGMITEVGL